MVLKSNVTASMRAVTYLPMAAVTSSGDLSAAMCNCKAGSCRPTDRGVCIHILPMLLQLSMLLFDGLAQNLLVELSHRWNEDLEKEIEESGKMDMIKDLGIPNFWVTDSILHCVLDSGQLISISVYNTSGSLRSDIALDCNA